ncbi:MAG: ATP-binding cassette domain-containing protein [Dehalococcoidia bacterium]|jgi:daunorubicin resistance ABC transporter ATP-binding subunit
MSDAVIVVEGLSKRFGGVVALDDVSLQVAGGTVFGLLGPNGAGKTTAVRVLTTIIRPDGGRASVLGHDVVREAAAVRYRIGLAGQNAAVDGNLSGRENLRLIGRLTQLPRDRIAGRADELLERFGLGYAADRLVRTYSGGMRRRLDLAAALVHHPEVVFLDEPTTGLDPEGRLELWDIIRELVSDGTTVLLTTQYLEEADRLANRVAVVDLGRVIAEGTPAELKARLGSTVLEVGLADEAEALRAEALLAPIGVERDGSTICLRGHDGPGVFIDALCSLESFGLNPTTMAVREPSLDDVFLRLTGKHVESDGGTDPQEVTGGPT